MAFHLHKICTVWLKPFQAASCNAVLPCWKYKTKISRVLLNYNLASHSLAKKGYSNLLLKTQCLKILKNVSFEFLSFSPFFCLVALFDFKLQFFKYERWDYFTGFSNTVSKTFDNIKCNLISWASKIWLEKINLPCQKTALIF